MPIKELTGQVFGRLTALSVAGRSGVGAILWNCRCACGQERIVNSGNLCNGHTRSCGCLVIEKAALNKGSLPKHGHAKRGVQSSTYNAWSAMKSRCFNPSDRRYKDYGGRGITVCARWVRSFENFLIDLGEKPKGTSLDRIDNNGNYKPTNCRWATRVQQQRNMRTNRLVQYNGIVKPVAEWAEEFDIAVFNLASRLKRGWSVEDALNRPIDRNARRLKHGTRYGRADNE